MSEKISLDSSGMTDDFCKEIAQFQEKYMVEDKDIEYSMPHFL